MNYRGTPVIWNLQGLTPRFDQARLRLVPAVMQPPELIAAILDNDSGSHGEYVSNFFDRGCTEQIEVIFFTKLIVHITMLPTYLC